MALPVVIPNTFANANASIPLSQLDNNFSTVAVSINGMANGAEALANVNITGGSIANASLSNVSISSGNVTINVANVTTLDATNVEVTNIKAKDGAASATIADATGVMTIGSSVLTTADINGGTIDNAAIGGATPAAGAFTTLSATSGLLATGEVGGGKTSTAQLGQPSAGTSRLIAWGPDNATAGIFDIAVLSANAGVGSVQIASFSSTGLAVTGTISATGAVTFPAGTALLPSITTTGDTNTGVYFPAADTVGITTAGSERMRINSSGNVGIGTASPAVKLDVVGASTITGNLGIGGAAGSTGQLRIFGNGSGATTFNGISIETSVQSDVTSGWRGILVRPTTQATAFTLSNLYGIYVNPQAFGAGSAVTNQYGVHVESTLTGATNNYAFYSNIASGSNRWNFYANGTADNYFAGSVGIGTTVLTNRKLTVGGSATGATGYTMVLVAPTVQPDVTTININISSQQATASNGGTPYTISNLYCFNATQGTFNADSTVTNQFGFAASSLLTGATNNYGFHSNIASGTGRWNFYANGTADNYFAGNVGIGTSSPTAKLDVSSDVIRLRTAKTPASASATGNAGDIAWDSSYIYVCVATNTWKRVAIATW